MEQPDRVYSHRTAKRDGEGVIDKTGSNVAEDLLRDMEELDRTNLEIRRRQWLREKPQLLKEGWTREQVEATYGV